MGNEAEKMYLFCYVCDDVLSGCVMQASEETGLTAEERERNAVRSWFENDIFDEDEFSDLADYQYYARQSGLKRTDFLHRKCGKYIIPRTSISTRKLTAVQFICNRQMIPTFTKSQPCSKIGNIKTTGKVKE